MRRRSSIVIGALAFAGAAVASGASAQEVPPTSTPPTSRQPTTTSPPITAPPPTSPTTTTKPGPTTTVKGATTTTTAKSTAPIPPPASGPSQPLDPSLLGGVGEIDLNPTTSTTFDVFGTDDNFTTTTAVTDNAINVASSSDGPSGGMLALAAVAWIASLGGLLVYAEDQRGKQWRHLAR